MIKYETDNWPMKFFLQVADWALDHWGFRPDIWTVDSNFNFFIAESYEMFFLIAINDLMRNYEILE